MHVRNIIREIDKAMLLEVMNIILETLLTVLKKRTTFHTQLSKKMYYWHPKLSCLVSKVSGCESQ